LKKSDHQKKNFAHGKRVKKEHGQNFLRDEQVLDYIVDSIDLRDSNIIEIGCGDGALTKTILEKPIDKLLIYEIDADWVQHIKKTISDDRLEIKHQNFLDIDLQADLAGLKWKVMANLPYHITFPILKRFVSIIPLITEGVIMVQEEVAQKIVANYGRSYGYISLYFQYYFDWKLLAKVPPQAFFPAPKVFSRLLYLKPREERPVIKNIDEFWIFIKAAFSQPRRTLRNCLSSYHYNTSKISDDILALRAQQISYEKFIEIWHNII